MKYNPEYGWEYDSHPNCFIVEQRCEEILTSLSNLPENQLKYLQDTRPTHGVMFQDVTPENCEYFAGNYRGADYEYLKNYSVTIGNFDGALPDIVAGIMIDFSNKLIELLEQLKKHMSQIVSTDEKLLVYVEFIAWYFVKFLAIHPYANGNGHIARLLVWVLLKKEDLNQSFWSVSERPGKGVPLDECICYFRMGNKNPLIQYFLLGILTNMNVKKEHLTSLQ